MPKKMSNTQDGRLRLSRLQTLLPEGTPVPGQTGGPRLTLELRSAHQQTLHPAMTCTPPTQALSPGSFTVNANTPPVTERYTVGSKMTPSRRERHQKVPPPPDPRGFWVFTQSTGGIGRKPRRCLQEENDAHGRRHRRPRTGRAGFHPERISVSKPESGQTKLDHTTANHSPTVMPPLRP
jgi:hypothetical protein